MLYFCAEVKDICEIFLVEFPSLLTTKEMKFDLFSTCFLNDSETPLTGQKADMGTSVHALKNIPAVSQVFGVGKQCKQPLVFPWPGFPGVLLAEALLVPLLALMAAAPHHC